MLTTTPPAKSRCTRGKAKPPGSGASWRPVRGGTWAVCPGAHQSLGVLLLMLGALLPAPALLAGATPEPVRSTLYFCLPETASTETSANEAEALAELATLLPRYRLLSCLQDDCCATQGLGFTLEPCGQTACLALARRTQLRRTLVWRVSAASPLHSSRQQGQLEALAVIVKSMVLEAQLLEAQTAAESQASSKLDAPGFQDTSVGPPDPRVLAVADAALRALVATPTAKKNKRKHRHRPRARASAPQLKTQAEEPEPSLPRDANHAAPVAASRPLDSSLSTSTQDKGVEPSWTLHSALLLTVRQPLLWSPGVRISAAMDSFFVNANMSLPLTWEFEQRPLRYWFNGLQLGWQPELWHNRVLALSSSVFACVELSSLQRLDIAESAMHWMFDVGAGAGAQLSYKILDNMRIGLFLEGFLLPTGRDVEIPGGPHVQINLVGTNLGAHFYWTL